MAGDYCLSGTDSIDFDAVIKLFDDSVKRKSAVVWPTLRKATSVKDAENDSRITRERERERVKMASKLEYLQRYMSAAPGAQLRVGPMYGVLVPLTCRCVSVFVDAADAGDKKLRKKKKKNAAATPTQSRFQVVDADHEWTQDAPSKDDIESKWEMDAADGKRHWYWSERIHWLILCDANSHVIRVALVQRSVRSLSPMAKWWIRATCRCT